MEKLPVYYLLMRQLKEMESLRETKENHYECFLKNHPNAAVYFYDHSHGHLKLYIQKELNTEHHFVYCSISSIDDSFIMFRGPSENLDKALNRLERFKDLMNNWDGWIPNQEQCQDISNKSGLFHELG